jgi:hypothetical protein
MLLVVAPGTVGSNGFRGEYARNGKMFAYAQPAGTLHMQTQSARFARLAVPLLLMGLTACATLSMSEAPAPLIRTENGPEAEARAALVHVVSVAQRQDVAAFKKLIYPPDLPDFNARERDNPGLYTHLMADISAEKLKDYRLELLGSSAIFTAQTHPKLGDYGKPAVIKVVLIRDGNEWKLGKS